jgi:hypothetical protein
MPKVPAPEECETLQAYYRRHAEEQTDDWAKKYLIGRVNVGVLLIPSWLFD